MTVYLSHFVGVLVNVSPSMLKQSISNFFSQTSFHGFHTEATLSGLWENAELTKIIKYLLIKMAQLGCSFGSGVKGLF